MVQASCDRHLLEASHNSVDLGPLSAVLRAMLILGKCLFSWLTCSPAEELFRLGAFLFVEPIYQIYI